MKMTKIYPDFPVCDLLFPYNSSIFQFFHVFGAESYGFKPHVGDQFLNSLNSLNYSGNFFVIEMYFKTSFFWIAS